MSAYYNEWDKYAAAWLRNLIAAGHIAPGEVDERSITDVRPDDLRGFGQCHFFAGIGGWSYAARLAGWPDDRALWTGSCPCQPFSVAGKGKAQADERHLWPELFRLASACRPAVLMGEQVAAAIGKDWIDGVFADLEGIGYACGAVVVPACAVDAPHRRDRAWFVADASSRGVRVPGRTSTISPPGEVQADTQQRERLWPDAGADGLHRGFWSDHGWVLGHDGKGRRVKPGLPLLAHGVPARVGKLRAYGNAIVPQVAAVFVRAFLESTHGI